MAKAMITNSNEGLLVNMVFMFLVDLTVLMNDF